MQPALRAVVLNVNFCDERYSITDQSYTLSGVFIFCGGRYKLAKLTQTYQTKALKKCFRKPTWLNPFCSVLSPPGGKTTAAHKTCCEDNYSESLFVKEDEQD